jgi:hypothetical protein
MFTAPYSQQLKGGSNPGIYGLMDEWISKMLQLMEFI